MVLSRGNHTRETVSVIGAGKVGTAVAYLLDRAGYRVAYLCARTAETLDAAGEYVDAPATMDVCEAVEAARVVLLTVPDDAIGEVARRIAEECEDLESRTIIHKSGSYGLGVLKPLGRRGARTVAVHPLQTFPDIEGAIENLPGSYFGVSCEEEDREWASRFVEDLGGHVLFLDDSLKGLYHAAAVIACNLVTVLEYCAEQIYRSLGMEVEEAREAIMPLIKATISNIEKTGPVEALTGPLVRGDLQTIRRNLDALDDYDRDVSELYRVATICGLSVVQDRGSLSGEMIEGMRQVLEEREGE